MSSSSNTQAFVTYVLDSKSKRYLPIVKGFPIYSEHIIQPFKTTSLYIIEIEPIYGIIFKFYVPSTISNSSKRRRLGMKMNDNYFIVINNTSNIENKNIELILEKLPVEFNTTGTKIFLKMNPSSSKNVPFSLDEAKMISSAINQVMCNVRYSYVIDSLGLPIEEEKESEVKKASHEAESNDNTFFYVEDGVNKVLFLASEMVKITGYANVLLTGPSGFGKTTIAKTVADKLGKKFVKVDVSLITEPQEIFGSLSLVNGSTEFTETPFVNAITEGGCVVLLDEINRAYPNILNPLLPLLDDTHSATYNGREYKVAKDTMFVVTANIGVRFTGTFQADAALMNRINFVSSVGNIPFESEVKIYTTRTGINRNIAVDVVKLLSELRLTLTESSLDFSPRTGISICYACKFGYSIRSSFLHVLALASAIEKRQIIDILTTKNHNQTTEFGLF